MPSRWGLLINSALICGIVVYQKVLSPYMLHACRFFPTCSEYAKESFRRFGPLKAGWLMVRRLLRCRPFGPEGVDFVP